MHQAMIAEPDTATTPSHEDAIAFVREHAGDARLPSGEPLAEHAEGTAAIMRKLNVDESAVLAAALFALTPCLDDPERMLTERFGEEVAQLVGDVRKLLRLGTVSLRAAQSVPAEAGRDEKAARRVQIEALRKMLLAFAADIRVVLIRLASRLQSLRYYAAVKRPPGIEVARETLDIYAPLANRLGIWQLKWELEDLAFRFEDPDTYKRVAKLLDEKRVERETYVAHAIERLQQELASADIRAEVSGRPKHIAKDARQDARFCRCVRPSRVSGHRARHQGLLRSARHRAQPVAAGAEGVRRLHFASEAQRLQIAAHGCHRRRWSRLRSSDPHARHAPVRRVRRRSALAL
jgi:GTP pyrophosphokinase